MNSVRPLETALSELIKSVTFVIDDGEDSIDFIELLREELEVRMGSTVVRVGVIVDSRQMAVADLASSLEWQLNKEQFTKLSEHPAVKDVLFTFPQPVAPAPSWGR
jgi:hypothetical protein